MDIKTRKQAMIDGENTYYTGKPCWRGHLGYRYTISGACHICVNGDKVSKKSYDNLIRKADNYKIKHNLPLIKIRLFAEDREQLSMTAWALAVNHFPDVTLAELETRTPITGREPAGTAMYPFYCHESDQAMLRQAANDALNKHAPDVAAVRKQIWGAAGSYLPQASAPDVDFS